MTALWKIEASIKPFKLDGVKEALHSIGGVCVWASEDWHQHEEG